MNGNAFWRLIDGVLDVPLDDRAARLQDRLAELDEDGITGFADQLAGALHRLDTPAHAAAAGEARGDAFLYIRCAAVLSGSHLYRRIVDSPQALSVLEEAEAEPLLFVAPNAYERSTDRPWEHTTPVSYESGSNAAWGVTEQDGEPYWSWLMFSGGQGLGVQPTPEYELTYVHLLEALDASQTWQRWWSNAPAPQAEMYLFIDPAGQDQAKVRKGRKVVRAQVSRTRHGFDSAPDASEPEKARDDIRAVLAITAERIGMPPMPEFPPLPELTEEELRVQREAHEESAALDRAAAELMTRLSGEHPGP